MRKANYDKFPSTKLTGMLVQGWDSIISMLKKKMDARKVLAVDLYTGVYEEEVLDAFSKEFSGRVMNVRDLMKPEKEIQTLTERFMTEDVLFGYVTNLKLEDYLDADKVAAARKQISEAKETIVIIGTGAAVVAPQDAMVVYADMARWEIQQRFRRHEVKALGIDNRNDALCNTREGISTIGEYVIGIRKDCLTG